MLISHYHRMLFIKPRKCAGTSLELALSPILEAGDAATAIEPDEESLRVVKSGVSVGPVFFGSFIRPRRLRDHSPLSQVISCYGRTILNYRIVTMTRNPWDRAVSQFFWTNRRNDLTKLGQDGLRLSFNDFTRKWGPTTWLNRIYGRKRQRSLNASNLYFHDGICRAQIAIRFENLVDDLGVVCDWLNVAQVSLLKRKQSRVFVNQVTFTGENFTTTTPKHL